MPIRWPSTRGSPRSVAQRPLPSMMTATWRGSAAEPSESLFLDDCTGRARVDARQALGARVGDAVLGVAFGDGAGRAGVLANAAGGAVIGDLDGHWWILLAFVCCDIES